MGEKQQLFSFLQWKEDKPQNNTNGPTYRIIYTQELHFDPIFLL